MWNWSRIRITRGIVLSSRKAGRWGISFGRYGDSPQRNGVPAKDFVDRLLDYVRERKPAIEAIDLRRVHPRYFFESSMLVVLNVATAKATEGNPYYGLAIGFTVTVVTIWLIPLVEGAVTWRWAFALLALGPLGGIVAMRRLRSLPEAS